MRSNNIKNMNEFNIKTEVDIVDSVDMFFRTKQ